MEGWSGRQEYIDALNRAIALLGSEERALVMLFYYEAYPVSECAKIAGLSESNIKVRLHRIRKKLYLLTNEQLYGKDS